MAVIKNKLVNTEIMLPKQWKQWDVNSNTTDVNKNYRKFF